MTVPTPASSSGGSSQAAFAERLTTALERRGLNQTDLGEAVGAHANTVTGWVRGGRWPRMEHLIAIASTLDMGLDTLVAGVERGPTRKRSDADEGPALEVTRELAELAPTLVDLADRAQRATSTD